MNRRASQPPKPPAKTPELNPAAAARARLTAAPPAPNLDSRLAQLAEGIEQFRVDTERFFNGGLSLPPEELRSRLQAMLRELRSMTLRAAADQYRLGTLEARFNSFSELFGRRLREREEGRGAPVPRAAAAPAKPAYDAREGIELRAAGTGAEAAAVEALWSGLAAAGGGRRLELETFRGYVAKQLDEIRAKTGAAAVQFRVVEEDGRLKLKAKPIA